MMRALVVVGLLVLAGTLVTGCEDPRLRLCDDEIKKNLRSPASYKRVNATGAGYSWVIEYDAVNSYNAPLRSKGRCFVFEGKASWYEDQGVNP